MTAIKPAWRKIGEARAVPLFAARQSFEGCLWPREARLARGERGLTNDRNRDRSEAAEARHRDRLTIPINATEATPASDLQRCHQRSQLGTELFRAGAEGVQPEI